MTSYEFFECAQKASSIYWEYLSKAGKGVEIISPISMKFSDNGIILTLPKRLISPDHSTIVLKSFRYQLIEFKFYSYDDDKRILELSPKPDMYNAFVGLSLHDITIESDMRFLVQRVLNWYSDKDSRRVYLPSQLPLPTSIPPVFINSNITDSQESAVYECLRNSVSYVWGIPGSGKTTHVLSSLILSYVESGKQVLLVAPTNNSLEQSLNAIIPIIEAAGYSQSVIFRLGVPSPEFINRFPSSCEAPKLDSKLASLQSECDKIKKTLNMFEYKRRYESANLVIKSSYKKLISCDKDKNSLRHQIAKLESENASLMEELEYSKNHEAMLNSKLRDLNGVYSKLKLEMQSFRFSLSCFFGIQNKEEREKSLKEVKKQIDVCAAAIAEDSSLQKELSVKINTINDDLDVLKHKYSDYSLEQEVFSVASEGAKAIPELFSEIRLLNYSNFLSCYNKLCDKFEKIECMLLEKHDYYLPYSNMEIDELNDLLSSISNEISNFSPLSTEERVKNCLVLCSTVDTCISRVFDYHFQPNHVFLDEAAYCPLIKAAILTAFSSPITFLGDHMQLPPVCEFPQSAIQQPYNAPVTLWCQSAIYLESAESLDIDELKIQYLYDEPPHCNIMYKSELFESFRYDANLANILGTCIYDRDLIGNADIVTDISFKDVEAYFVGKNENKAETVEIANYISSCNLENYIILTPYKNQVKLLKSLKLPHDRVSTIHSAQGQEWDTVIISATTKGPNWFTDSKRSIGKRVLNTAISRAKHSLILFLDWGAWEHHKDQFITMLCKNGDPQQPSAGVHGYADKEHKELADAL